jgi:hypothetical protein
VTASAAARLGAAVAALLLAGAAVVVAVDLLRDMPGPTSEAASSVPSAPGARTTTSTSSRAASALSKVPKGFPAPPADAVVFSREDGYDTLALGVVPKTGGVLAQVSVLTDQGAGRRGLAVHLTVQNRTKRAAACGPGCYRAAFATLGVPRAVTVDVKGFAATTHWRVPLPVAWPAPDASALMAGASRTWRALTSLAYVDRLASGPHDELTSLWQIVAPDRVAYRFPDGSGSVIIGEARWDKAAGGTWQKSVQEPPLQQPVPFWSSYTNAHVLGSGTFAGRPVWRISFFDPVSLAWFEIALEKQTRHTLDLHMNTTAHFMHDTYGRFDQDVKVEPPVAS